MRQLTEIRCLRWLFCMESQRHLVEYLVRFRCLRWLFCMESQQPLAVLRLLYDV